MKIIVDAEKGTIMPTRAHSTDAGLDLYSPVSTIVKAGGSTVIDTGIHIELPPNTAGFLKSKSWLNVNHSITSEGVIDVGYTGSIKVKLYNNAEKDYTILAGDKISQLVILPIIIPALEPVDNFTPTERGSKGFGSSGR